MSGCPNIVENSNGKCPKHHKAARKESDKRTGRIRGSKWSKIRKTVLTDRPFCACTGCDNPTHVLFEGKLRCREPATEVDHITPLSHGGHPTSRSNLQGLCHYCHEQKTRREFHGRIVY